MKIFVNYNKETKNVDIDVYDDLFGEDYDLSEAMPYVLDALYEEIVKDQKRKMMR